MAKPTDKERVGRKQADIDGANKVYDKWTDTYSPDLLERYFYGLQWENDTKEVQKRKYVINMFYPSLKVRQPSLLFFRPKVKVDPRPGRNDDMNTDIEARARLQQDTVNTYIQMPEVAFNLETGLAVFDAQFRFGVAEIGYTADFIDNPNSGKPVTDDYGNPMQTADGSEITQPSKITNKECIYVKWIPGNTFRVSANAHNRIERCDWAAYYEWHHIADLKSNPNYKNTTNLKATGQMRGDATKSEAVDQEADTHRGMVKVWKRWNLRKEEDGTRMRYMWVEGGEKFLLEKDYKIFPFAVLKFDERLDEFYPLPPTFNWVSPQNELNETREQLRVNRSHLNRQYQMIDGSVAPEEVDKFAENEDGSIIKTTRDQAIQPIQTAPLDNSVVRTLPLTKEDFREISGISGEERGIAEAETATQANIIQLQSRVRESFGRVQVAQWLSKVGEIMLETIREYMTLPFWIKVNVDPTSATAMQESIRVAGLWKQIEAEQLGDMNYDISVDVESLSPVAEETERNSWLQMLTVITNPALQIPLAASEVLLRKTVGYFGIKSERDIAEIQKAMGTSMMVAAQQALAQAQAKQGGGTPGLAAPGPTPTNQDIQGQLQAQLPQPVM